MKRIRLTNFQLFALVDDEDYELLSQYKWRLGAKGYVMTSTWEDGKSGIRYMHREVLKTPKGMDTEHADQNRLNNQRSNLRVSTRSQNMANVYREKKKTALSKYKGVSKLQRVDKWVAYIRHNYHQYHLGYFATQEDAARAYNAKATELFGDFASLNDV